MHSTYSSSLETLQIYNEIEYNFRRGIDAFSIPRRRTWKRFPVSALYKRINVPFSEAVARTLPVSERDMLRRVLSCASRCKSPAD